MNMTRTSQCTTNCPPKFGVVRSRDMILQSDVKVGIKAVYINVKRVSLKHV